MQEKKLCNGVYIHGSVQGTPVVYTTDTGASRTIISQRVYNRISKSRRPVLERSNSLRGASGRPIEEFGKAELTLRMGPYEVTKEVIVADIEDEVLLGFDVLGGNEKGPADILLSKNVIVFDCIEVPCFQVGKFERSRKVVAAETTTIPAHSEGLVQVYVERDEFDDYDMESSYLVEPVEKFKENYELVMASTLVNINKSPTCQVRVMNPYHSDRTVRQDAEIARAEKIEGVISVIANEESEEKEKG